MKIVITGGHITPALALLPILLKKHDILFVVRKHTYEGDEGTSFEYDVLKKQNAPFTTITAGRLQRRFTRYTIPSFLKFPAGFVESLRILREFRPDLILSFGGYVALPVCLAGATLKIPIVIHEQTVKMGLANKLIATIARKICVSFRESLTYVPQSKSVLTGNPIRNELFHPPAKSPFSLKEGSFPIIYVTGGSGGSHVINSLVGEILEPLLEKYIVIHQTGDSKQYNDFERLGKKHETLSPSLQSRYIVRRFINEKELAWIYSHASLLIGRSGANTVYEVLAFGLPSLLIPLPWAGGSEQEANADLVKKVGLGIVLTQEGLTGNKLFSEINLVLKNVEEFKKQKDEARKQIILHAQEKLVDVLEQSNT